MGGPEPRPADDEGAPRPIDDEGLPRPPPLHGKLPRGLLKALERGESITFMAIAVGLLVIALVVFAEGIHALVVAPPDQQFAVTITRAVNSALFIVVVLELVRTIIARLEGGGFQLQPFLVIGIISATRDILTVGAELSLVGEQTPLVRTMTELGVNAGVVLALSVALVLVRRLARLDHVLNRAGDAGSEEAWEDGLKALHRLAEAITTGMTASRNGRDASDGPGGPGRPDQHAELAALACVMMLERVNYLLSTGARCRARRWSTGSPP